MIFNKELFNKNAPVTVKNLLSAHLDALDGAEVEFGDSRFGQIKGYKVNCEYFCLYPVLKEWCSEQEQLILF